MRGSSTFAPARSGVEGTTSSRVDAARERRGGEREVPAEAVVDAGPTVLRQTKRNRGVALRIEVDQERGVAGVRDRWRRG